MKNCTRIPVSVNGRIVQCEILPSTTCRDVINVTTGFSCVDSKDRFAVYEFAYGVDKMLPPGTKILDHMRTWGDAGNAELKVRKVDVVKSKMASIYKARQKLQRLRSLLQRHHAKCGQNVDSYLQNNLDTTVKPEIKYDKNITAIANPSCERLEPSKVALMKRYLQDSAALNFLQTRTPGDGIDEESGDHLRLPVRTPGDDDDCETDSDINSNVGTTLEHDLNLAFMSCDVTSGEETVKKQIGLNDCVLYDSDDDISVSDKESAFGDDSDCSSVCDFERNISELDVDDTVVKMERIKSAFSYGDSNARITEDELLDSFMNTFVARNSDDEGLSSVGSDFE